VRIDPPLLGQPYGLGACNIDFVFVATRHQGSSLFPITEWPVFVHVARPLIDEPALRCALQDNELESIAWAELYPTEEAARKKEM
jgi:hypothetical protein